MNSENINDSIPSLDCTLLKESTSASELPEFHPTSSVLNTDSHLIQLSVPKNQKQLGTCTSFAIASLVEQAYGLQDLSEAYFTVYVESQHGQDGKAGLSISDGMKYAKNYGFVEEEYWKYQDYYKAVAKKNGLNSLKWLSNKETRKLNSSILVEIPPHIEQHPRYTLSKVEVIFNRSRYSLIESLFGKDKMDRKKLKSIKQLIASDIPVIVSVPIYSGKAWDIGVVTKPHESLVDSLFSHLKSSSTSEDPEAPQNRGWHAIVLCGFDNQRKQFTFKNSWGTDWGQGGYGTITYEYIKELCDIAMYGTK